MPMRTLVLIDGQNLYRLAMRAYGPDSPYHWPSYDVVKLAHALASTTPGRTVCEIRFYTGVPSQSQNAHWHRFWNNKLRALGRQGVYVYRGRLNSSGQNMQEKGVDVSLALDLAHITEMVGNFAAHLTRDEMAYGAQERGLNWGSIRAPDELVDEGHLNDRGFWVEVPNPELDRSFKYPGPAGIYNGSPWRISRRAPLIGEHNEEIYCGELGLQRTELAYLAESGVV